MGDGWIGKPVQPASQSVEGTRVTKSGRVSLCRDFVGEEE